ncbi:MAG TPA: hypothetical protein PKI00_01440, partial [Candidatus Pacearchaeota archaeon]|nr:hypothetical protein [Candidatus Pacearchaeota archaeon]
MEEENIFKLNMKKIRTMKKDLMSPLDDEEDQNITIPSSSKEDLLINKPPAEEALAPEIESITIPEPEP